MEKGGIRLVVLRPGARRAPAASGSAEWIVFLPAATPLGFEVG